MSEDGGIFAYNSYCDSVKTTYDNKPLPTWEKLGDRQKQGWIYCYESIKKHQTFKAIPIYNYFDELKNKKELSFETQFPNYI